MIEGLIRLANHLDLNGYRSESNFLDKIISLASKDPSVLDNPNDIGYSEPSEDEVRNRNLLLTKELEDIRLYENQGRAELDDGSSEDYSSYIAGGWGIDKDVEEVLRRYNESRPNESVSAKYETLPNQKTKVTWV
tara:strand:+ start:2015 stop:2419 length:405 start_codon:yes stop_codon:yes gene_type:complete